MPKKQTQPVPITQEQISATQDPKINRELSAFFSDRANAAQAETVFDMLLRKPKGQADDG